MLGLRSAPSPGMCLEEIAACVEWVAPGLEVVQSIYPAWEFTTEDSIINGGMHGCLVLGERISTIDLPQLLDGLPEMEVSLCRDGIEVESGRGANALDGPITALQHLSEVLADSKVNMDEEEDGDALGLLGLQADELVTTGTLTDAWPIAPGETWAAHFSAPCGSIMMSISLAISSCAAALTITAYS